MAFVHNPACLPLRNLRARRSTLCVMSADAPIEGPHLSRRAVLSGAAATALSQLLPESVRAVVNIDLERFGDKGMVTNRGFFLSTAHERSPNSFHLFCALLFIQNSRLAPSTVSSALPRP